MFQEGRPQKSGREVGAGRTLQKERKKRVLFSWLKKNAFSPHGLFSVAILTTRHTLTISPWRTANPVFPALMSGANVGTELDFIFREVFCHVRRN
jgi:hypothetical protein